MRFELPHGFNVSEWVRRWDRMQERYNVRRDERFSTIVDVIESTNPEPALIIDLGCGTGSLTRRMLQSFPSAYVVGIDLDPTLLALAKERLARFGGRFQLLETDLRKEECLKAMGRPADAIVSSTALHWLSAKSLAELYRRTAGALRPGGIFLNADHVGSKNEKVAALWENQRQESYRRKENDDSDDWTSFWEAYGRKVGIDLISFRKTIFKGWEGVEEGLPLEWQFHQLLSAGYESVDCYWRFQGDAVYGGVMRILR